MSSYPNIHFIGLSRLGTALIRSQSLHYNFPRGDAELFWFWTGSIHLLCSGELDNVENNLSHGDCECPL